MLSLNFSMTGSPIHLIAGLLINWVALCMYSEVEYGFKLPLKFISNVLNERKQGKSKGFDSCDRSSNLIQIGFISSIFQPAWPWNLMNDLKKQWDTSSILYKLCASFQIHWWIKTGVTVRKRSIRVKIDDFLSCVTFKFDGWPWKIKGHLSCTTLSFVHHFKAINEFELE